MRYVRRSPKNERRGHVGSGAVRNGVGEVGGGKPSPIPLARHDSWRLVCEGSAAAASAQKQPKSAETLGRRRRLTGARSSPIRLLPLACVLKQPRAGRRQKALSALFLGCPASWSEGVAPLGRCTTHWQGGWKTPPELTVYTDNARRNLVLQAPMVPLHQVSRP